MHSTGTLAVMAFVAGLASAHMQLVDPPPIRSRYNPAAKASGDVDNDMTAPLSGDNFPCKKYHVKYAGTAMMDSVATYSPGQSYSITIGGGSPGSDGAPHGGGSCQVSLSYDNGKTFTVIKSIQGECPLKGDSKFPFTVPADAPKGKALLAWSWNNFEGNREFYMNCASVTVGGGGAKLKRVDAALPTPNAAGKRDGAAVGFSSRPAMFVANLGFTTCKTADNTNVIYPNPGPDLQVNPGHASAPPKGDCGPTGPQGSSDSGTAGSGSGSGSGSSSGSGSGSSVSAPQPTVAPAGSPSTSSPPGGVFVTMTAPAAGGGSAASTTRPAAVPVGTGTAGSTGTGSSSGTGSSGGSAGTNSTGSAGSTTGGGSTGAGNAAGAFAAGTACTSDQEGAFNCLAGGTSFQRCGSGRWWDVQAVAPGTTCTPGISMSFKMAATAAGRRRGVARRFRSPWAGN